jgi:hypothetical protein
MKLAGNVACFETREMHIHDLDGEARRKEATRKT